ncbi:hypothetical protein BJP36_35570 [Moorena producens JHB]|uniref:Uncharacterized protein n=1 Tax=Moorena producens (strain JHB) TaxID=1454205 RepID=A0A9Q9STK3_MOOP1|nr:hypothetical protein [Moorena producens]WAN69412.1 hypothetical protein BJP36_35570 [Moorena producens JHB]
MPQPNLRHDLKSVNQGKLLILLPLAFCLLPTPDSRLPRCAFRRRIKFATGRTAPYSLLKASQRT